MKLKLFDVIDEAAEYLELNEPAFQYVQGVVVKTFVSFMEENDSYLGYSTRIKSCDSLKEKIIRNKYYLKYKTGGEIVDNLPDLIGVALECRFLRDEQIIFQTICKQFEKTDTDYYVSKVDSNLFLNLTMKQPQSQANGLSAYRIDGYYLFNGDEIRYELQIKSLTHNFWSEIEHQIVYKNNHYVMFNDFMQQNLFAIRGNLNTIDHQLQIMYDQVKNEQSSQEIGMSENGFKMYMTKTINDLYCLKMRENGIVDANFKKGSAMLSQYLYINNFIRDNYPQQRMIQYYEHLDLLKRQELSFSEPIVFEEEFADSDPFVSILGEYLLEEMNIDFDWRTFFGMLFAIQSGNTMSEFRNFLRVLEELLVNPTWFTEQCGKLSDELYLDVKNDLLVTLATALVEMKEIKIIYEENVFSIMNIFRYYTEKLIQYVEKGMNYQENKERLLVELKKAIQTIFLK